MITSASQAAGTLDDLRLLLEQNLFAPAALTGDQLLAQNPNNEQIIFLTAYAHQMNAESDRAVALYNRLIDRSPQLPEPRNNLAMIYLARGDYDRASEILIAAINTHSSYATAYQNLNRIYTGIASESYRRAISESTETEQHQYKIELDAIAKLDTVAGTPAAGDPVAGTPAATSPEPVFIASKPKPIKVDSHPEQLFATVRKWAAAWSAKDIAGYISFYTATHRPKFSSHSAWVDYRRKRILRANNLRVTVSELKIRKASNNEVRIDFNQAFDSSGYSDRVRKRLVFSRIGSEWKISEERVISVL